MRAAEQREPCAACYDDVFWQSSALERPTNTPAYDSEELVSPAVGQQRWVWIGNEFSAVHSEETWLLFQPASTHINGFRTEADVEASCVVKARIIEANLPTKETRGIYRLSFGGDQWFRIEILKFVPIAQIIEVFAEAKPTNGPSQNAEVQIFNLGKYLYYHLLTQECSDWFITTNEPAPRMILRAYRPLVFEWPIEICNFSFDIAKWPHRVYNGSWIQVESAISLRL